MLSTFFNRKASALAAGLAIVAAVPTWNSFQHDQQIAAGFRSVVNQNATPRVITVETEGVTRQGKPFLEIEIGDGTATEKFKVWEDNQAYDSCAELQDGDCVKIDGTFFRNQFGMNVDGLIQNALQAVMKDRRLIMCDPYSVLDSVLAAAAVIYVSCCWFVKDNGFKGLTEPRAFEQAEFGQRLRRHQRLPRRHDEGLQIGLSDCRRVSYLGRQRDRFYSQQPE